MQQGIVFVAGTAGIGKTTWIQQSLIESGAGAYCAVGSDATIVDATYVATEVPNVQILTELTNEQLAQLLDSQTPVFIELGFHIALDSAALARIEGRRVAIVPPNAKDTEWHQWADEVLMGVELSEVEHPQIQRSLLTGEVFDPASLQTFWDELTQGAYGSVQRAKGIFDLVDGRSFHFNFVVGLPDTEYTELKVPQWVDGRPNRFSGIEIVGAALDQDAIAQTLEASCLSDQAIAYYQAQIRESLAAV